MRASERAALWREFWQIREIAKSYLETPYAEVGIRPLALGLLKTSYILETLLLEHGPELDQLGREVVRDEQGKAIERVQRSPEHERDEPEV